jgi:hypothetical protein
MRPPQRLGSTSLPGSVTSCVVVTREDFPTSWQGRTDHVSTISPSGRATRRFHDSRDSGDRFMLRLDRVPRVELQGLAERFETSKAEVLRRLIAQACPETFPESWHRAVANR